MVLTEALHSDQAAFRPWSEASCDTLRVTQLIDLESGAFDVTRGVQSLESLVCQDRRFRLRWDHALEQFEEVSRVGQQS